MNVKDSNYVKYYLDCQQTKVIFAIIIIMENNLNQIFLEVYNKSYLNIMLQSLKRNKNHLLLFNIIILL